MIRIALALLFLALALPALAQDAGRRSRAPSLKAEATVSSEIVRIGDLVENAGAVADVPIFRAPDLGQTGAVRANRVADAVRPHHIVGSGGPVIDTRGAVEATIFAKKKGSASGYAVPTSIVRTDLAKAGRRAVSTESCAP